MVHCIDVQCVNKFNKRISIFKAEENETEPYRDVSFDMPENRCFIEHPIKLEENDSLSIYAPNSEKITSITFATPSTLPKFPFVVFTTFPNLEDVHLVFAGVKVIEEDHFANATSLRKLRLEQNNIKIISKTSFAKASKLEVLELPTNRISEIDNFAFVNLHKLTKLDLQQNNLTVLREHAFSGAYSLTEIFLNGNQIQVIEDGALYFDRLSRLYLQDNRLRTLSPNLFIGTPLLNGVDLSRNQLVSINKVFDKCPLLTTIGLDENQIESIDLIELANIRSLMLLSMEGNKIKLNSSLPNPEFPNSKTKLIYLNLDSNNLSSASILKDLSIFHQLKFLDLDDNRFTSIDDFKEIRTIFPYFIQLNLNNNPLSCEWFKTVKNNTIVRNNTIILKTTELNEEENGKIKYLGNNMKSINGTTCYIRPLDQE